MLYDYLDGRRPALELGGMTEKTFFEAEIRRWKTSEERQAQLTGDNYYRGKHDILKRERRAIGPDGKAVVVTNIPNNKIVHNLYAKMVDQKANYLLGQNFVFATENARFEEALGGVFDKTFYRTLLNVGKLSLNCGVAWVYVYYDDGELKFKEFNSWEILPFWKDEAKHDELDCVVRVYEVESYVGGSPQVIERVEIYKLEGVERYELADGVLVPDTERPFEPYITKGENQKNWGAVPVVPFRYRNEEMPLVTRVKTLQDALNETLSDFRNNMQEDSRNTILVIRNYDGENLGEFRRNLATYGCVKVRTVDGQNGDVTALEVKVDAENYRVIIAELKKAIVENAMGYDAKDERLSGAPNQMNLLSMYNDIDLDANGMETEYQQSFEALLYFICLYLNGYFDEDVEIIFNRDMMMNEGEVIENIQKSEGLLSKETLTGQHPWVTNTQAELDRLAEERLSGTELFENETPHGEKTENETGES